MPYPYATFKNVQQASVPVDSARLQGIIWQLITVRENGVAVQKPVNSATLPAHNEVHFTAISEHRPCHISRTTAIRRQRLIAAFCGEVDVVDARLDHAVFAVAQQVSLTVIRI